MAAVVETLKQDDTASAPIHDEDKGKTQTISNNKEDSSIFSSQNRLKYPSMDEELQTAVKDFVTKNKICPLEDGMFDISYFASLRGERLPIHVSESILQDIVNIPKSLHNYEDDNQRLRFVIGAVMRPPQSLDLISTDATQFGTYMALGVGKDSKKEYSRYPMVVLIKESANGVKYVEVHKEDELARSAAIQQAKTRRKGSQPTIS